jgi:activator of Hsp90 ATPase-like protein
MYGTFTTIDDRPALIFERRLAHPVAKVWRAVTDPAELAHWFPGGAAAREVVEVDPPRLVTCTLGEDLLRIELEPADADAGCTLRFTAIFDDAARASRDAAGWHVCLDALARRLDGADTPMPGSEPTPEWRERYDEYQRRGLPAGAPVPGG